MDDRLVCACCGIAVHWQPTIVEGKTYCCPGCAEGGPCRCDYDNLPAVGELKALARRRTGSTELAPGR